MDAMSYSRFSFIAESRKCRGPGGSMSLPVACPGSVVLSGTPTSPTTKTGRHDIAEILLKVALNTKIQIQIRKCMINICI
jgi:hypothetical protein